MPAANPAPLTCSVALSPEALAEVHAIRFEVFCDEQRVDRSIELEFETESIHFLAYLGHHAVATARWRLTPEGIKVERCAVRRAFRGSGVGHALVQHLLASLPPEHRHRRVYLHAQTHAQAFYERLHFIPEGAVYMEAGIEHIDMVWQPPIPPASH